MSDINMSVNIAGVELKNPVTVASGTFGSGMEYGEYVDLNRLGAVTTKGVANIPWPGNPTPRIAETYGGMMNAIGLQNPGLDTFVKRDIPFLIAGDAIMPGVLIAQACGRWGNFFNQEAYGGAVSLNFLKSLHLPQFIIDKMYIHGTYYQPTFLYESIGCVLGFLIIFFVIRKFQKKQGIQFFSYFIWYGIIRFFIESFRTDSLYVFGLKTAQLVSIAFVIVGMIGFIYCHLKGNRVKDSA